MLRLPDCRRTKLDPWNPLLRTVTDPAANASDDTPCTVEWVRKRDGEIVRFEPDNIARSLRLASQELDEPLPLDTLEELARMASFFVRTNATGQTIESADVAERVEQSLRETGQIGLADSCNNHRARKRRACEQLVVSADREDSRDGPPRPEFWSKSRVVETLRVRLGLDARQAREIASRVERTVLAARWTRLSTALVREIVNNELAAWNIQGRLAAARQVHIGTDDLKRHLSRPDGPSVANRLVTGKVWRDFSLEEVVAPDVADAERRGLVRLSGIESPATLAATCVDCTDLVRSSRDPRESIAQFGARLAAAVETSSIQVAIDGVEAWLTSVAGPNDTPGALVEQFWHELCSRVRHRPIECVLNFYGGLPAGDQRVWGAGPLFSEPPVSAQREFAGAVCQEVLDRVERDACDWPSLRSDWHWSADNDPVQLALWPRVTRLIADGLAVAVVFDRGIVSLGAGLRRIGERVRPVLDYAGLNLPLVWRDAGSPRSVTAIDDVLRRSVELALHGALQRREFIRRLPTSARLDGLDQAILAIYPIGLDWTVAQLTGKSFAEDDGSLRLAETIVRQLRAASEREARHFSLAVVVDHPTAPRSDELGAAHGGEPHGAADFAGMTPSSATVGVRRHIFAAGRLHEAAMAGTLVCRQRPDQLQDPDWLNATLEWAGINSQLIRLQLVADRPATSQGVVRWPES